MAWVEVWLENTEVIRWGRRNEKGMIVYDLFPAQKKLIGRCEATPKAIAELVGIDEELAGEALSKLGEPVFIGDRIVSSLRVNFYLIVYPTRAPRNRK
jgi:hypothetical protein